MTDNRLAHETLTMAQADLLAPLVNAIAEGLIDVVDWIGRRLGL
ncbi:hypothetical protein [Roseospirillum parvum]|uniref:Uncharacterized protein n=1 Tax=Roseospirillum parvum TaxID=83401 RepID=A0A1G8D4I1_9PROT|nr:hypothetical protein [Roseospirillum parvum]SDH52611.1 hypothetical protein SAMN05421742_107179 [Roseospirillum parvum]